MLAKILEINWPIFDYEVYHTYEIALECICTI